MSRNILELKSIKIAPEKGSNLVGGKASREAKGLRSEGRIL